MLLWMPMMAQTNNSVTNRTETQQLEKKDSIPLSQLEKTRIVLKDGSIKKNCHIKEINDYWILYLKDGSLHDQAIDKIRRIEITDGTMRAVFFDENNRPRLDIYSY